MANLFSSNCIIHNSTGITNYTLSILSIITYERVPQLDVPDKINLKGGGKKPLLCY